MSHPIHIVLVGKVVSLDRNLVSQEEKTKNGILTIKYWVGNNKKNLISLKRLSCIGFLGFKIEG